MKNDQQPDNTYQDLVQAKYENLLRQFPNGYNFKPKNRYCKFIIPVDGGVVIGYAECQGRYLYEAQSYDCPESLETPEFTIVDMQAYECQFRGEVEPQLEYLDDLDDQSNPSISEQADMLQEDNGIPLIETQMDPDYVDGEVMRTVIPSWPMYDVQAQARRAQADSMRYYYRRRRRGYLRR